MNEDKPIISERIKSLRKEKKLTQEQLAEVLGLNAKSSIANYESGANSPSDDIKKKMCELFNCSMDYLMGKTLFKSADNKYKAVKKAEVQFDFNKELTSEKMKKMNTIISNILKFNTSILDTPDILKRKISETSDIPEFNELIETILFCMIESHTLPEEVDVNFWYNHSPYSNIEDYSKIQPQTNSNQYYMAPVYRSYFSRNTKLG